jgi:ribosomal protein S18 acetylase RimI-like enzyme
MIQSQRSSLSKLLLGAAICAAFGGGIYYYGRKPQGPICEYQESRDKAEILALFNSDWYWLTASEDYDPVFMLDRHAPNKRDERYYGALKIKVLREQDQFIGFIAYYRKTFSEGFILFVTIKPELRGKHYAEKLMHYAEKDLKSMGVSMIRLVTRTTNHRAQKLYDRLGYGVIERDEVGGFVYFVKMV